MNNEEHIVLRSRLSGKLGKRETDYRDETGHMYSSITLESSALVWARVQYMNMHVIGCFKFGIYVRS